jgi:molybdopterin synthase sulfur carrier subunit
MARVRFGGQLMRHVTASAPGALDTVDVTAATVGEALAQAFERAPAVKGYVVDEHFRVRKHVAVFIDGKQIADRAQLDDAVGAASEVYVLQALSGG